MIGFKSCVADELCGKGRESGGLGLEQCFFIQKQCSGLPAALASAGAELWLSPLDGVRAL